MPGKKGRKSKNKSKFDASAIKQIWGQIDVADWLNVVRTAHPNNRWTYSRQTLKGQCPFHQDKTPSFVIDLGKRYAKCYSTECGKFFWDPVRFYMAMQGGTMTYHKALTDMKNRFGIQMSQTIIAEIGKRQKHREMKKLLFDVMRGELIDCYAQRNSSTPDQELFYARDALAYLDKRGIPPVYHNLPVGVYPTRLRLETLVKQKVPYLGKHMSKVWDDIVVYLDLNNRSPDWVGSLVFFTGSSPQDIARLKLRKVPPPAQSNFAQVSYDKDICFIPDDYEHSTGIFGLFGTSPYLPFLAREDVKAFYYMEGEFDALSIIAQQFHTGDIGFFAFSGGGGSAQGLDTMANFGFDTGYIVGDHDKAGKGFVQRVLENTAKVAARAFVWPQALLDDGNGGIKQETDPSDAVETLGYDVVNQEFRKEENFIKPYQWAVNQAAAEMSGIDKDDIRHLTAVAANWGKFVRDTAEQHAYVGELTQAFNISSGQILSEIKAGEENEEAFIERIRDYLANRLHILQRFRQQGSHILRVYDSVSKEIYELPIEEKMKIASAIGAMTGKDVLQFVREDIGEPAFLEVDEDSGDQVYIALSNKCIDYLKAAVTRLSRSSVNDSLVRQLGAGLHCIAPNLDKPDETFRLYHVNGLRLIRGDFDSSNKLVWKDLTGPSDDSVVVHSEGDLYPRVFMPHIRNAADLNKEPDFTAKELFDIIYQMLDLGWDFKNHKVTCELMAAFCMGLPIANVVGRQPLFMVTSEQSSGKSSLIGGFIGRSNLPRINIIQSSVYTDNYTVAGVRQLMNRSSLCLCLDEFEDKGGNDRRSSITKGILQLFRGHSNEEGLTVIGSTSGQHRSFFFHSPAIVAGIRGLQEAADISRFIKIEMDKKGERESPETLLTREFGEDLIRKVRLNLPLVMYRQAKAFYDAYNRIDKEYQDGGGLEFGRITRSREHFYSSMAVMAVCGKDYHRFIRTYFRQHRLDLERISQISLSSDLLDEVLHTPNIRINDLEDTRPKSLNNILSSGNPEVLNQSYSGIYYDWVTKWIAVHWPTVKGTKLLSEQEFRNRDPGWLKNNAARNKYHVPDMEVERSGVLQRLAPYMGKVAFRTSVSVFNATELMGDAAKSHAAIITRGRENIDMMAEFGEAIDKMTFPKPPAKKEDASGTSKGSPVSSSQKEPDLTEDGDLD